LPIEARLAAWDRLWQRLLAEPVDDPDTESQGEALDDEEERPVEAA
jgi:glucose-6-phosphate dehydrogenase assembly protein OpcA